MDLCRMEREERQQNETTQKTFFRASIKSKREFHHGQVSEVRSKILILRSLPQQHNNYPRLRAFLKAPALCTN